MLSNRLVPLSPTTPSRTTAPSAFPLRPRLPEVILLLFLLVLVDLPFIQLISIRLVVTTEPGPSRESSGSAVGHLLLIRQRLQILRHNRHRMLTATEPNRAGTHRSNLALFPLTRRQPNRHGIPLVPQNRGQQPPICPNSQIPDMPLPLIRATPFANYAPRPTPPTSSQVSDAHPSLTADSPSAPDPFPSFFFRFGIRDSFHSQTARTPDLPYSTEYEPYRGGAILDKDNRTRPFPFIPTPTRSASEDRRDTITVLAYRNHADLHSIRHTFITNLCKTDVSPKTAQMLARYNDIRITIEVYTHVDQNEQIDAIRKFKA